MRAHIAFFAAALLGVSSAALGAARLNEVLGHPVTDQRGERLGRVSELIIDVREARVLYAVIDTGERYFTFPVRALQRAGDERLSVDRSLADAIAERDARADPRFARAGRLLGLELENPGGERIGNIADMLVDLQRGRIEEVVVQTDEGRVPFPPSVLAAGRFPPLTRWQVENPPAQTSGNPGYVRREPSQERRSVQER